jgi:hypothetical protein
LKSRRRRAEATSNVRGCCGHRGDVFSVNFLPYSVPDMHYMFADMFLLYLTRLNGYADAARSPGERSLIVPDNGTATRLAFRPASQAATVLDPTTTPLGITGTASPCPPLGRRPVFDRVRTLHNKLDPTSTTNKHLTWLYHHLTRPYARPDRAPSPFTVLDAVNQSGSDMLR